MSERLPRPAEIFVVEDNPIDVEPSCDSLAQLPVPVEVHHAPDGATALSRLRDDDGYEAAPRPDLVLLDINMPGVDGKEVLRRIRASEQLREIPVVVRDCPVRVLYVEDDPLAAEALCEEAKPWFRHPVEVVPDAESALHHLLGAGPRPDVVLLDLGLPGPSGFDALRAIREDPDLRRVQVVALTGRDDDETVRAAYRGYVNALITKPDAPDGLFRVVLGIAHWYSVARTA